MVKYDPRADDRVIMPRAPVPFGRRYPLSTSPHGAASIPPGMVTATQWSPYGEFVPHPYLKDMPGSLMAVAQAETYDASPNPWPNNGQFDRPNGFFANLLRLKPHTSAHPGLSMTTGGGPTMYFHAPPVFSLQTKPIPAVGI